MIIETERLKLMACTVEILNAAIESNTKLSQLLNINVPEQWTEFGIQPLQFSLQSILNKPENQNWFTYFPIIKETNTLAGSCGYKGAPLKGEVEIGYEVAAIYRGHGFATEITKSLIDNAFKHPEVNLVVAHTLAQDNASVSILRKFGFNKTIEVHDPEDGLIWRWELNKVLA